MRWTSSSLERKRPQLTKSGDFTKYLENGSQAKVVGEMAILRQQFSTRTALSSSTSWRPTIAFDVVFVFVTSLSVNDDIRQSVYGFFECNLVKSPVNAKYQVSPVRRILLQLKP